MVRLKSRYILFEILFPTSTEDAELEDNYTTKDILLRNHKVTPEEVTKKMIINDIRHSLQLNFGDYGSGKASSLLQLKYFSNMTSTGIIRCHREDTDIIVAALALIDKLGDTIPVIVNPVKVSGTMKKIEEFTIRRSKKIMMIMQKSEFVSLDRFKNISIDENDS